MADNRAFSTGVMNEGGSPVYYEDKKLSERSAVSGAAAIANLKFLLVNGDDDGFNTAIKAYIDEAVRSAFGALVDNLDKGTAISRVLATDANHDLGSITPANLASVLGVNIKFPLNISLTYSGSKYFNMNDVKTPGMYWMSGAANNPYGTGYSGILVVLKEPTENHVFQLTLRAGTDNGVLKYRWWPTDNDSWTSWKTITAT